MHEIQGHLATRVKHNSLCERPHSRAASVWLGLIMKGSRRWTRTINLPDNCFRRSAPFSQTIRIRSNTQRNHHSRTGSEDIGRFDDP